MCCDTLSLFGKDIPISNFLFILQGGGGGDGLDNRCIRLGSFSKTKVSSKGEVQYTRRGSSSEQKVLSSVVVCSVSQLLNVLTFMGGVEMGDGSDGSGDCGLYSSLPSCVWVTTAIVFRMLKGLGGKFRSIRLHGTIESCRPNPYSIVGSFELSSMLKIWGSGDAIDETEGIRAA